ncbi:MAG TPA: glycosyltransferase family 39 protein [Anaerolineae bacterium]|nr:glycosyltransferase family 39 protein [Anaerolineae bacterium]
MSDGAIRPERPLHYTLLILLITLLGFAARFINLGGDSLWFDELFTLDTARQSLGQVLAGQDINNPLGFHLLSYMAVRIWGTSEYALRLASAAAGTVGIPLLFVVGSLIANRRVGFWAAALLAVSPFHIRYSQEARAYAVQMAFSLASMACLLLALARGKRWWVAYGVLTACNAYLQFSAFLVLASQLTFVGLLTVVRLLTKRWTPGRAVEVVGGLLTALAIAAILYGPWIGPALQGVAVNLSAQVRESLWSNVSIEERIAAGYFAFGFMQTGLAAALGLLSLVGIAGTLIRRKLDQVLWLLSGVGAPLVLIAIAGIARAPLPKHLLFILPIYLVAVAIGLDALGGAIERRVAAWSERAAHLVPAALAMGLLLVALPLVLAEHAYVYNDWKGVAQYLKRSAHAGAIVVPITLDLPDSFNQGYGVLSHYLPQIFPSAHLLIGERLADPANDLAGLVQATGEVWFTLLNRVRPVQFDDPTIQVIPFQESIYLIHPSLAGRSPLHQLLALYPKIIPQALTPAPQCYLWLDLALLHIQAEQHDQARVAASNFQGPCPDTLSVRQEVYRRLLDHYAQAQQTGPAREAALQLVALDAKDQQALEFLSVYDLNALFEAGLAQVVESPALPVKRARFTMPQDGDWGEVVLMQTPAQLTYHLALPSEPVEFRSRIALAPESWEWGGDGSTFALRLEEALGHQANLFEQYLSNAETDRRWYDVRVPLNQYAGQAVTLTLVTDPGPAGDTTGDWAGWDTPRIVYALTH